MGADFEPRASRGSMSGTPTVEEGGVAGADCADAVLAGAGVVAFAGAASGVVGALEAAAGAVDVGAAGCACGAAVEADAVGWESLLHATRFAEQPSSPVNAITVTSERRKQSSKLSVWLNRTQKHGLYSESGGRPKPVLKRGSRLHAL